MLATNIIAKSKACADPITASHHHERRGVAQNADLPAQKVTKASNRHKAPLSAYPAELLTTATGVAASMECREQTGRGAGRRARGERLEDEQRQGERHRGIPHGDVFDRDWET